MLKFTLVENDATLHGVHTDTVVFSPCVLTRAPHEWLKAQENDPRHMTTDSPYFHHHGSVTLG